MNTDHLLLAQARIACLQADVALTRTQAVLLAKDAKAKDLQIAELLSKLAAMEAALAGAQGEVRRLRVLVRAPAIAGRLELSAASAAKMAARLAGLADQSFAEALDVAATQLPEISGAAEAARPRTEPGSKLLQGVANWFGVEAA